MHATDVTQPPPTTPTPLPAGLFCPWCGYDLRGATRDVCTECGGDITLLRDTNRRLPWIRARGWRKLLAYWSTAWIATAQPPRLAAESAHPPDYPAARRFQAVTLLWLALGLAAVLAIVAPLGLNEYFQRFAGPDYVGWFWVALAIGALCWLPTVTGVPTYLFHPRRLSPDQQDRAITLSYYASAPLAFVILAAAATLMLVYAVLEELDRDNLTVRAIQLLCFPGLLMTPLVLLWWLRLASLAARLTHSRTYGLVVFVLLPVLWSLTTVLTLGLVTALVFYVVVILKNWP